MAETWMAAADRNGIPCAFLVATNGRVAWIGHPMQLQEETIDEVLAGTFDLQKAAEAYQAAENARAVRAPGLPKRLSPAEEKLNEAAALRDRGNLTEAETKCREALALNRKLWTNDTAKFEGNLIDLSDVLQRQGKYTELKGFLDWMQGQHPDWSMPKITGYRLYLLEEFKCDQTLAAIQTTKAIH